MRVLDGTLLEGELGPLLHLRQTIYLAEMAALVHALEHCARAGWACVVIHCDCKLVVDTFQAGPKEISSGRPPGPAYGAESVRRPAAWGRHGS